MINYVKKILTLFFLSVSIPLWAIKTDPLHLDWIDSSFKAKDNFYAYANGQWQKKNPIPPQYASWGTFAILQEKTQKIIHQLLINASKNQSAKPGSIEQKVGDFYYSGMDEALINQLGATPLNAEFERIEGIKSITDLQEVSTYLQQRGVDIFFNFGSMQDFKNSNKMIAAAGQDGLGLPDRDYYLKEDAKFKGIRAAYLKHIGNMFKLLGDSENTAHQEAQVVMQIETLLAKASMSQIEQRDPRAIYHIKTLKELEQLTPNFSWTMYFKRIGYPTIKQMNLAMPDFFKTLNGLIESISLADWKTYLRWHVIDSYASYLSKPFVDEDFEMSMVLSGTKEQLPRWQRVVSTTNSGLGFAIGQLYVKSYFPPSSKVAALNILRGIKAQLRKDLQTLPWMTPATRVQALKKLDLMGERVGYPSQWRDYSSLVIDRGPYVLNVIRVNEFLNRRDLNKIGKPVDRTEWAMPPQTVNAYYDPSNNNINIPAGILQSPFFDPDAPASVNYGGIGFVIGHEMTHGFDDQGSQFDGHGNLNNWWKPNDLKQFHHATDCIATLFSSYKVDGDLPVQGKLVVGEATADLGGLTLAYRAFHEPGLYQQAKTVNGLTPDQQFFLGVAHIWAGNMRTEQQRNLVTIDPHPPMEFRVNGTLANMPQFQAAFEIPEKSPMVNEHRCVIW